MVIESPEKSTEFQASFFYWIGLGEGKWLRPVLAHKGMIIDLYYHCPILGWTYVSNLNNQVQFNGDQQNAKPDHHTHQIAIVPLMLTRLYKMCPMLTRLVKSESMMRRRGMTYEPSVSRKCLKIVVSHWLVLGLQLRHACGFYHSHWTGTLSVLPQVAKGAGRLVEALLSWRRLNKFW